MTRWCFDCKQHLDPSAFSKNDKPCKACRKIRNINRMKPRREYSDNYKLAAGCMDCGLKTEYPTVLEFDHRGDEPKVRNVSDFVLRGPMEALVAEIAKCDVVCANCHRVREAERFSSNP